MELNEKTVGQVTLVAISGALDAQSAPLAQARLLPLTQTAKKMLLDLSGVSYLSSAGLRLLLLLYRQMTSHGGWLALVGLSEDAKDTMSATGFLSSIPCYDSVDAGLAALSA